MFFIAKNGFFYKRFFSNGIAIATQQNYNEKKHNKMLKASSLFTVKKEQQIKILFSFCSRQ